MKNINAANSEGETAVDVALGTGRAELIPTLKEVANTLVTEEVAFTFSAVLAEEVASCLEKTSASRKKETLLNLITKGLAELKKMGFSERQMAVARKTVAEHVRKTLGLVAMRGLTEKSAEERVRDNASFTGSEQGPEVHRESQPRD
jgi:hypothetical protein